MSPSPPPRASLGSPHYPESSASLLPPDPCLHLCPRLGMYKWKELRETLFNQNVWALLGFLFKQSVQKGNTEYLILRN